MGRKIINFVYDYAAICLLAFVLLLFVVGLSPFNFTQVNMANISVGDGLHISRPGSAYTAGPSEKLLDLNQFTIYIDLASSSAGLRGFEKIFSYFISQNEMNFIMGQWKDGLGLSLRADGKSQEIHFGVEKVVTKDNRIQCIILYDGTSLVFYINGKKCNKAIVGKLQFSTWNDSYPLVLGADANGRSQWEGKIYQIAMWDRSLSPEGVEDYAKQAYEVDRKDEMTGKSHKKDMRPLIHYVFKTENTYETEFRGMKVLTVRDLGKGEPADLVIPEKYAPYERVFLRMPPTDLKDYRPNIIQDMYVNFFGFLPLGILLFIVHLEKDMRVGACIALAVVTGFALSLTIELLQAFLPTRYSGMLDLLMNTLGTLFGSSAIAYAARGRRA